MIDENEPDNPQLVYRREIPRSTAKPMEKSTIKSTRKLSLLDRLLALLCGPSDEISLSDERAPRGELPPSANQAIVETYEFVSRNYQPGSQVILVAHQRYPPDNYLIKALEILAQRLHGDAIPEAPRANNTTNNHEEGLRIHGVVVYAWDVIGSIGSFSDQLTARFSSGIEHIICHKMSSGGLWSCSTTLGSARDVISREIYFYTGDFQYDELLINVTKAIIYYKPVWIPDWERLAPVWSSALSQIPEILAAELEFPVGMYRHELQKFSPARDRFFLVWRSFWVWNP